MRPEPLGESSELVDNEVRLFAPQLGVGFCARELARLGGERAHVGRHLCPYPARRQRLPADPVRVVVQQAAGREASDMKLTLVARSAEGGPGEDVARQVAEEEDAIRDPAVCDPGKEVQKSLYKLDQLWDDLSSQLMTPQVVLKPRRRRPASRSAASVASRFRCHGPRFSTFAFRGASALEAGLPTCVKGNTARLSCGLQA